MDGPATDIGQWLLEKGAINTYQLRQARHIQKHAPGDLGLIILDLGFCSERMVAEGKADLAGLRYVDLTRQIFDRDILRKVPVSALRKHVMIPLERLSSGEILIAVTEPAQGVHLMERLSTALGEKVQACIATKSDIQFHLNRLFGPEHPPGEQSSA